MIAAISPIKRFFRLLQAEGTSVKKIYLYALFNGLVALSLPLGIQAIISFVQTGQITASWLVLVAIVVGGIILAGALQVAQLKTSEEIQQRIYAKSALELSYRLPKIKSEEMYHHYAPELANRFFDTLTIQKGLSKILIDFTSALMQIAFGLLLLAFYHPFFIVLALLITFIIFFIIKFTFQDGLQTSIKESKVKYQTAHWLEEIARSVFSFKLSGNSDFHIDKTDNITEKYLKARQKHFKVLVRQYWSMIGFKAILALSLLLIGGFLVINKNMNIGQFVAAEIIILLVLASVEKLILSAETIYDVLTAFDKLGQITDLDLERENKAITEFVCHEKGISISLAQLNFSYPGSSYPILQNINLEIFKGAKVGLIGLNSSGKASLLNIISTLYQPSSGILRFNNFHLSDISLQEIRTKLGSYLESEELFEGTLYENITLMRKSVRMEDVMWVIEKMKLLDFVNNNKEGLQTLLKPTGKALSKSVVQKILLARAVVIRPELLVISNNLENLSTQDKRDIVDFLCDDSQTWTLVAATHDAYFASKCKHLVYMEKGSIQAEGNFKQLIQNHTIKNILYAQHI